HGYLPFCQSLSCTRTSPTEIYTLSLHDALPISRLARLEVELAVSETRRVAVDLGLASAVAMVAAIILVTGLTVTLAAALAPIFGADWRPLLSAGGGGALLAGAALAWSIYRVRH